MLTLPDLDVGQEIVADNIRLVQAIYFASQLEELRAFESGLRLVELFEQGLLPLGRRSRSRRLLRSMATTDPPLSMQQRRSIYTSALDPTSSGQRSAGGHRDFHFDWLRFVASVALPEARHDSTRVVRAAIALAASASARGAGLQDAANKLAVDANRMRALFEAPDIQRAFGARDMWQVIEQISGAELGGALNVARRRARAVASSTVLQWLADHADAFGNPSALAADALIAAVDQWLASNQAADDGSPDRTSTKLTQ